MSKGGGAKHEQPEKNLISMEIILSVIVTVSFSGRYIHWITICLIFDIALRSLWRWLADWKATNRAEVVALKIHIMGDSRGMHLFRFECFVQRCQVSDVN